MNSPAAPLGFPVAARYVVTDDLAAEAESALGEVFMPVWLQIALPVAFGLQVLTQLPVLLSDGSSATVIKAFVFIGVFYGFMFWRNARNKRLARAAMVGKEVAVQFRDDGFDYLIGPKTGSFSYSSIARAGRDGRGLVLVVEKLGGIWIPTWAFASPEHRDFIFDYLGQFLKKR